MACDATMVSKITINLFPVIRFRLCIANDLTCETIIVLQYFNYRFSDRSMFIWIDSAECQKKKDIYLRVTLFLKVIFFFTILKLLSTLMYRL